MKIPLWGWCFSLGSGRSFIRWRFGQSCEPHQAYPLALNLFCHENQDATNDQVREWLQPRRRRDATSSAIYISNVNSAYLSCSLTPVLNNEQTLVIAAVTNQFSDHPLPKALGIERRPSAEGKQGCLPVARASCLDQMEPRTKRRRAKLPVACLVFIYNGLNEIASLTS